MGLLAVWSFASPWMLPWLVAVAIPIAIHLWSRRRYQDEVWAATQFLLAALRRHQRRLSVEQLLLLVIRVLVLVLLALALAEPLWSGWQIGGTTTDEPPRFTVLVIDTSYSMGFQEGGRSRFEQAKQLAADSVRRAKPGDAFALVTLSEPPRVIIARPSADHAAVADEIEHLELSHAGAALSATLREVASLMNTVAESPSRFLDRRVDFLTDLGRTTWQFATTPECRQLLNDLDNQALLEFRQIGGGKANNLAVTRIETEGRAVVVGAPVAIHVEVENAGAAQENQKRIELFVDDRKVAEKHVNVAAGARAAVTFNQRLDVPGDREIIVRLSPDGLSLDDWRALILPVRETIRVLCIEGKPDAAAYVAWALNPAEEAALRRQVQVASEYALLENDLQAYDCVFVCNVARLGPAEAAVLRDYVAAGGGLVVALGDLVDASSYNQQLSAPDDTPLLPLHLKSIATGDPRYFVADGYEHPLIASFRGHERAGLLTVPVWSYWELDKLTQAAQVAIRFGNQAPAVVASEFGRGRVVVVSTALSPESVNTTEEGPIPWNALPAWPSFPPLVHELVHFATQGMQDRRNVIVGEAFASRFLPGEAADSFTLQRPHGGEIRPDEIDQTGWRLAETTESGVYRATQETTSRRELFAANLDTKESDLLAIDRDLLAEFTRDEPVAVADVSESSFPFFRLILACMVLLLVIETVLAWSFGRAKA